MKYERYSEPVISRAAWLRRVGRAFRLAATIFAVAMGTGVIGYHFIGRLPWVDSILEASMILAGEGPIAPMNNDAVKLFASVYALFSGFIAITGMAIVLTPWLHRMMHHLHATPPGDVHS
jgi:hypothetical protein